MIFFTFIFFEKEKYKMEMKILNYNGYRVKNFNISFFFFLMKMKHIDEILIKFIVRILYTYHSFILIISRQCNIIMIKKLNFLYMILFDKLIL